MDLKETLDAIANYKPYEPLTFDALRAANIARLPEFRNKLGELAHEEPDGSDWSPAQWLQAVMGELGEYANWRKKYERGDISLEEFKVLGGKELADVMTYLDILAQRCLDVVKRGAVVAAHPTGVDLGAVTMAKWNEVSERVNTRLRLAANGPYIMPADIEVTA